MLHFLIILFYSYVLIGKKANGTAKNIFTPISSNLKVQSQFSTDTSVEVAPPTVDKKSIQIYEHYVSLAVHGGYMPKASDLALYQKYVNMK